MLGYLAYKELLEGIQVCYTQEEILHTTCLTIIQLIYLQIYGIETLDMLHTTMILDILFYPNPI